MSTPVEQIASLLKGAKPFYSREEIDLAKRRMPLTRLLPYLGDEKFFSRREIESPFHPSGKPRFHVYQYNGRWVYSCCPKCGFKGDQIDYLKARFNLSMGDAIRLFCRIGRID